MTRFVIKPGLADYSNSELLAFAQTVASLTDGNLNYSSPIPTLLDLNALITDFDDAIIAWGTIHNRGSSIQHQAVLDTRFALETALTTLSNYCMMTTPYNKAAFMSAGWAVKSENGPVGLVGPIQDFHQFISRLVPSGAVKLKWKRPLDAPRKAIAVYRILNAQVPDINAATEIGLTTKTSFIDLLAGTRPINFYWVIPVCVAGNGGIADAVVGYPQGPVTT